MLLLGISGIKRLDFICAISVKRESEWNDGKSCSDL